MTNKNTNPAAKPTRRTFSADYKLHIVWPAHSRSLALAGLVGTATRL